VGRLAVSHLDFLSRFLFLMVSLILYTVADPSTLALRYTTCYLIRGIACF
jgi:hypothetical protein